MWDEGPKAVAERIRRLKAKALADGHGDIRLDGFWLLADNCWNGKVGDFLLYDLCLNPFDEWNTIILATDERTAAILDTPVHPHGNIPYLAENGERLLLGLRDQLHAAHEEVQRTHEFGRFSDVYDDTVAKVKKLAQLFHEEFVEVWRGMLRRRAENPPPIR
jgi:hypothetical protein